MCGGSLPKLVWPKHNMVKNKVKVGVTNNAKTSNCWCDMGQVGVASATPAILYSLPPMYVRIYVVYMGLLIHSRPTGHKIQEDSTMNIPPSEVNEGLFANRLIKQKNLMCWKHCHGIHLPMSRGMKPGLIHGKWLINNFRITPLHIVYTMDKKGAIVINNIFSQR